MATRKAGVDPILGPLCECGHHQFSHYENTRECLADMEGPGNDACGPSDCGCPKFKEAV
jgi:hypothetical protein